MSLAEQDLRDAADLIEAAQSIVMACHVSPDGDALGSLLALGQAIRNRYPHKSVTLISHDGVPEIYRFLPGQDLIVLETPETVFDLAIALDSGDIYRLGERTQAAFAGASKCVDIDHHVNQGAFGDLRLLDSTAAATAEIVYDLIGALHTPITVEIATCLLTGIITDTGSFRFMNVTPSTLHKAANLIEFGAKASTIAEQVFDNRTFAGTQLLGLTLSHIKTSDQGLLVWSLISHDDYLLTGASDEETEGAIGYIRSVRGSEVGLLFRETVPGKIRISLRSSARVDVAAIAKQFSGGGHKMAAGCTVEGTLADAETAVLAAVRGSLPR